MREEGERKGEEQGRRKVEGVVEGRMWVAARVGEEEKRVGGMGKG